MVNNRLIVHIDDSEDEQLLFAEAIRQIDKSVNYRYVSNGEEAIRLMRDTTEMEPDVIFLDLNMPRMSGKECLKALRAIDRFKAVPIIIYTTSTEPKDIKETQELGATAFMSKHISFSDMKVAISDALAKYLPPVQPQTTHTPAKG